VCLELFSFYFRKYFIFMCVKCMQMCVCVYTYVHTHVKARVSLLDQITINLKLSDWLDWMANELCRHAFLSYLVPRLFFFIAVGLSIALSLVMVKCVFSNACRSY
jgi:ABC-type Fe3+-siderophore transport system permease subunit